MAVAIVAVAALNPEHNSVELSEMIRSRAPDGIPLLPPWGRCPHTPLLRQSDERTRFSAGILGREAGGSGGRGRVGNAAESL